MPSCRLPQLRCVWGGVCFSENKMSPWCTRRARFHVHWLCVPIARSKKNREKVLILRLMISVLDQRGRGTLSPFSLPRAAMFPILTGKLSC